MLKDADLSLLRHKARDSSQTELQSRRELEIYPSDSLDELQTAEELEQGEPGHNHREQQKSPAASFGSQQIGAVILPLDLQQTITRRIAGTHPCSKWIDQTHNYF